MEIDDESLLAQRKKVCPFYEILLPVLGDRASVTAHHASSTLHASLNRPDRDLAALDGLIERQRGEMAADDSEDELSGEDGGLFGDGAGEASETESEADAPIIAAIRRESRSSSQPARSSSVLGSVSTPIRAQTQSQTASIRSSRAKAVSADDKMDELVMRQEGNDDRRHQELLAIQERKISVQEKHHADMVNIAQENMTIARENAATEKMKMLAESWNRKMEMLMRSGKSWEEAKVMVGPEPGAPSL
ncbi:hypothetical protein CNM02130 [Cryptococcus deneoformans JEC21]|uniref:Uncharacterized protein n=1 Tax=Cryptococcus deneoformans (strain JEC21 / ATCC MYA-565) TaxID=214684 RepID=Q5K7K3_CRYD1|nr:hypothetical protein CNM02130 [Cryptococcus neoformans var. neoformans JEC21]AAW46761.2 hypothetical protein CNM02130 [Cryptococcus neoformans var. neoformans JEC21]